MKNEKKGKKIRNFTILLSVSHKCLRVKLAVSNDVTIQLSSVMLTLNYTYKILRKKKKQKKLTCFNIKLVI